MHSPNEPRTARQPLSLGELQGMALLNRAPAALAFRSAASPGLPQVLEAPSLEGLQVSMPAPASITGEAIVTRFEALRREVSPRRNREPGEVVALGDDVLLDVIGFANGKLLPFSARADWWTEATPDAHLPGFLEALVGARVGESFAVELTLPEDHAVESLRGAPARFGVELKAAREVTLLDEASPDLFTALDRGTTLDEVMEHIAGELSAERNEQHQRDFQDRVLAEVARRTRVEVPLSLVDEEIRLRWSEGEYPVLVRLELLPEQLPEALEGWLQDVSTRSEVEQRLRLALGLRAIIERDGIRPEREDAEALFDGLVESTRLGRAELGRMLQSQRKLGERFDALAMQVAVVSHILAKATAL